MKKLFRRLFKKSEKVIVIYYGKRYKFNTFEDAIAFMLKWRE